MDAGELLQGRYRLEQALGKGGMATVWKAYDQRLERTVALKCLMAPLSQDPDFLVRFFQEAQQVARISHPNVVHVLDFGDADGRPYLVMEYVPGGTLNEATTPMEPQRALRLVADAAAGANAAHEAGLVHRDLKPTNIMLTDDGTPKIADFGIAVTQAQERLTATGTAIGSPHYVSPEQASGKATGPPSDVYSLGVVLYELLAGRRPFELDNATALAIAHVEETPEPPSVHNPSLSPDMDAAVMRCLQKDPEARFANGAQMSAALHDLVSGAGTSPLAAVAAVAPASAVEADDDVDEAPTNARRAASVAALTALFLGLLIVGVMALGGNGDNGNGDGKGIADAAEDSSAEVSQSPSTSSDSDEEEGADGEAPLAKGKPATPSPTETTADDGSETNDRSAARTSDADSGDQEESRSEPTPEPTPEPTSEPTSEPTPESTSDSTSESTSEPTSEPTSSP